MSIIRKARSLRRSQTEAEKRLWKILRNRQLGRYKFRRQFPIDPFIADFACFEYKLVVEIDGGQHDGLQAHDESRTRFLERRGYKVLRFWNNEVMENTDGVLQTLTLTLSQRERELARKFNKADLLVVATHNKGKVVEISRLLAGYASDFKTAGELGLPEPEETGLTFIDNAVLKAVAAAKDSGFPALADDSGISVNALGGEPGIYSARWAITQDGTRDFNFAMRRVQDELGDNPDRGAKFVCAMALAWPDGHFETVEGEIHGTLVWPPRGDWGFGYDPMFVPDGYDVTFAEMESAQKEKISHRTRAFEKLIEKCFR